MIIEMVIEGIITRWDNNEQKQTWNLSFYIIFINIYFKSNLMHFLDTGTLQVWVYAIDQIVDIDK